MIPSSGGDTSNRLRRAKSASSVQQHRQHPLQLESTDPHAIVAAYRAMERSSERASDELRRSESRASKSRAAGQGFKNPALNVRFSPAHGMRGQQSSLQPRTHASPSIASPHDIPTEASNTDVDDSQYASSLTNISEFGRTENYGAEPSSYRRLRKAKSMLTPRRRAMSNQGPAPPIGPAASKRLRNVSSSLVLAERGFKVGLKRSISFLRTSGNNGNMTKTFNRPPDAPHYHEGAVQIAREQYFQDMEQRAISEKSSSLFHHKIRHQQKAFRKSVRTSRLTNFGDGVKSDNQNELEDKSKIRSISTSFRERVMRIFGKSASGKDEFPPQQLDATRQHFRDYLDVSATDGDVFNQHPTGVTESTSRHSLYIPLQQEIGAIEGMDQIPFTLQAAAGRESLHSVARSRVTSWTNSTATGSLAMRGMTPLEHTRLPIIKEDGRPHQPSSSAGRLFGEVNSFQKPMGTPVNSQRLYSALMRRINQEEDEIEHTQKELDDISQEHQLASKHGWRNTTTIRPTRSESSFRTVVPHREHQEFGVSVLTWDEQTGIMMPEQHLDNIETREERLEAQEAESAFYPVLTSGGERKLASFARESEVIENSTHEESESGMEDREESTVRQESADTSGGLARYLGLSHGSYGMKSDDSVYSRTTCGGVNMEYIAPIGSNEDIGLGTATIIPAGVNRYQHPRVGWLQRQKSKSGGLNERSSAEWSGWLENEMGVHNELERQESQITQRSHVRETAQIDGDDVEIGSDKALKRFPLLELKEVSKGKTPLPTKRENDAILVNGQSGLLSRRQSMTVLNSDGLNDENKRFKSEGIGKGSLSLRKISQGNVARILRGTSGMNLFRTKENEHAPTEENMKNDKEVQTQGESPPVRSPGKKTDEEVTPTGGGNRRKKKEYRFQFEDLEQDGLSERGDSEEGEEDSGGNASMSVKEGLFSARLSRPFDSMCGGKDDGLIGSEVDGDGAAHIAASGGGVIGGARAGDVGGGCVDSSLMGTPKSMNSSSGTIKPTVGVARKGFKLSSKRMVSDFLRSRRRTECPAPLQEGSHSSAFI
jgi:hypothetical protein